MPELVLTPSSAGKKLDANKHSARALIVKSRRAKPHERDWLKEFQKPGCGELKRGHTYLTYINYIRYDKASAIYEAEEYSKLPGTLKVPGIYTSDTSINLTCGVNYM